MRKRTLSDPRGHPGHVDAAVVDASGRQRGGAAAGVRPCARPRGALLAVGDGGGAALASAAAHVGDLRQAVHGHEDSCGRRRGREVKFWGGICKGSVYSVFILSFFTKL